MVTCFKTRGDETISSNLGFSSDQVTQKNISVVTTLSQKTTTQDIRSQFDSFRVDVILPDSSDDKNAQTSCYVALNLLPRFMRCVRYIGPAKVLKMLQPSHTSKINLGKDDWNAAMTLVFGEEKLSDEKNPLYIGSSGWSVYVSKIQPCGWNPITSNNLAALYAGGLAVGEVFKNVLTEVKTNNISHLEYDLVTHGQAKQPVVKPEMPELINFNDLTIVGCGAIGQALAFGLKFASRLAGKITLLDYDNLELSNEQRYIGAFEEIRGQNKAVFLGNFLTNINPTLTVIISPMKYEDFAQSSTVTSLGEEVVVAVDNVLTRLNVQAGLPKILWNGWTDISEGSLRYGIDRHTLEGENECLGCSYYPEGPSPTEMDMNSIMTGLSLEEIQQKLQQNAICTLQDIQKVSKNTGVPLQNLLPNVNRPFHELLHGNCGVFRIRVVGGNVVAPVPHVPFLAGIQIASQLVLSRLELPSNAKLIESNSDFDALGIPNFNCLIKKQRNPKCFCNDPVYQKAYDEKWNSKN